MYFPYSGDERNEGRKRRKKWVNFVKLKRAKWQPTQYSIICSEHFKPDDFSRRFSHLEGRSFGCNNMLKWTSLGFAYSRHWFLCLLHIGNHFLPLVLRPLHSYCHHCLNSYFQQVPHGHQLSVGSLHRVLIFLLLTPYCLLSTIYNKRSNKVNVRKAMALLLKLKTLWIWAGKSEHSVLWVIFFIYYFCKFVCKHFFLQIAAGWYKPTNRAEICCVLVTFVIIVPHLSSMQT